MAKKTLGYVHLEWTCPNCGSRNPGPQKLCSRCGAPQPVDVQFEQPAEQDLIEDQDELARAKRGPDIHCAFCGTRNPAGAEACSQCGAPLGEGKARATGQVVGAYQEEAAPAPEVTCPSCGAKNPASALACSQCGAPLTPPRRRPRSTSTPPKVEKGSPFVRIGLLGCLGIIVLFVAVAVFLTRGTDETVGYVDAVRWTRSISVEGLAPVNREGWRTDIPAGVPVGTCTQRLHHTEQEPVAGGREVCGTPYTVDKGSGFGEVVQDCVYEVYADWCKYTVQEWRVVDKVVLEGADLSPAWPTPPLAANQRLGPREEVMQVVFETDGRDYTYRVKDEDEFGRFELGSKWELEVNRLGGVTDVRPAR